MCFVAMVWTVECGGGTVKGAALAVSMTTKLKKNLLWHIYWLWKLSTVSPCKRFQPQVDYQTISGESGKGQPGQHFKQSCSSFSIGLKMVTPLTCTSDKSYCSYICKTLCVSSQLWTPPPCLSSRNLNRFLCRHLSLWIATYAGIHWANQCTQQRGEQNHSPR